MKDFLNQEVTEEHIVDLVILGFLAIVLFIGIYINTYAGIYF